LRTGPRAPLLRDEPRALRRRSTRRCRSAAATERRRGSGTAPKIHPAEIDDTNLCEVAILWRVMSSGRPVRARSASK
jgi:hypothetical protein